MPDELRRLAIQLTLVSETERTGRQLLALHGALDNTWRANRRMMADSAIPIPPPRGAHLHPTSCEVSEADLYFEFALGDDIGASIMPALAQFQVRVSGGVQYNDCIVELEDHWRVDTHNFNGTPREPHPLIHFQRDSHPQDDWAKKANFVPGPDLPDKTNEYWRALMQSPGPRIPFPPLCPLLVIDFVIGQYDGDIWNRLRGNPEYRMLVEAAQTRLWTPFFDGLTTEALRRRWLGPILL